MKAGDRKPGAKFEGKHSRQKLRIKKMEQQAGAE